MTPRWVLKYRDTWWYIITFYVVLYGVILALSAACGYGFWLLTR